MKMKYFSGTEGEWMGWCMITILWPFLFTFGYAIERAAGAVDRWLACGLAAIALGHSAFVTFQLNFRRFTDETEPYVYVQTSREIHTLMLDGAIHLAGYRTDADSLLAAADVVALSSREEGMGSVLLDALAFGRPVAATRAGGIPEVIRDN